MIARRRIEGGIVDALVKTLSQKAWLAKLARRIEEKRAEAQGRGPENRTTIRRELERLDKEIENFMNIIAKGLTFSDAMAASLSGRERRKKLLESELRKLAEVESQKGKITPDLLRPRLRNLVEKIAENPASVRATLKGLFPGGIKLAPPKDKVHGAWRADLTLDGGNVVFMESFRRGNSADSRPRNSQPPDRSEGCEFSESAFGSALSPRHGRRVYFGPPRFCFTDSLNTRGKTPEKTRAPEWARPDARVSPREVSSKKFYCASRTRRT